MSGRFSSPFAPLDGQSYTASPTTSKSDITLTLTGIQAPNIRIINLGPSEAFMKYGVSSATATTSDVSIPVGAIEVWGKAVNIAALSFICASGSATIRVTCGEGV